MALPAEYFACGFYSDDTKGSLIGTAHHVRSLRIERALDAPETITLVLNLTDPNTGGLAKTNYCEIAVGYTSPVTWAAGYVQTLDRTVKRSGEFTITLAGPLIALADFRSLGGLQMNYPNYLNVLDWLNGTNAPGTGAAPGQKGILSGTGWVARWMDYVTTPVASTTTSGTVAIGATAVGVVSTTGMTQWDAIRIGNDTYELTKINSAVNISIHPAAYNAYGSNLAVQDMGYTLPGTRVSGGIVTHQQARVDWDTCLNSVKNLAKDFNFHFRSLAGSTRRSGTLQIGQFGDDSTLTVYGDQALLAYQQAHGHAELTQANIAQAQADGLSVILGPSWSDDQSHIVDMVYGIGKGHQGKFVDLSSLYVDQASVYTYPASGGRIYHLGQTYSVTTLGQTRTYTLFRVQQQEATDPWAYGVMNQTAVTTYDPHEGMVIDHHIDNAPKLLESCLQAIDQYADPLPTWTLPVKHPMTDANALPCGQGLSTPVLPGQKITVNYTGLLPAIDDDTNPASATYGQLKATGSNYTYLSFPASSDPTYKKLSRVIKSVEEWSNHQFTATYTLGRGHTLPKHFYEDLSAQLVKIRSKQHGHHTFTKRPFHHVPWLFSQNPDAYEDISGNVITLAPGAVAVADVPDAFWFSDHHAISFTFSFSDTANQLRFWFAKPLGNLLINPNAGAVYGLFNIAASGSGGSSGFFTTTDGSTYTSRGSFHTGGAFDANKRLTGTGTYRAHIRLHGSKFEALVTAGESGSVTWAHHCATWNDTALALASMGSIGFYLVGGTGTMNVLHVAAHPLYAQIVPKQSISVRQLHPITPHKKHRRKAADDGSGIHAIIRAI